MDDKTTGVGGERGEGAERMSGRGDESIGGRAGTPRAPRQTIRVEDRMTGSTAGSAAARGTTATGARDRTSGERTEDIRAEIEQTREDMSETVNAIQERLRPGNVASNAAERVRHAARDKARDMADSDVVQGARANPIPTAMIGIGLAGAAWMAFNRREGQRYRRRWDGGRRTDWRVPADYRDDDYYRGFSGRGEYETAGSYTPGLAYGADVDEDYESGYRTAGSGAREQGRAIAGRAGDVAGNVRRRARQTTYRAQSQLRRTWNESPLLVGAAAGLLGLLVGLAVPETERENQLMGETRDNMVEGVQEMAKDAAKKVQQAATGAATSAVGLTSEENASEQDQPGRNAPKNV